MNGIRWLKISSRWGGQVFLYSVALILILTALAKVFSAGGAARILARPDPVLMLDLRSLLVAVAFVEGGVAAYLLLAPDRRKKYLLILWLSASFTLYRVFLWRVDPGGQCPCLGSATESLGLRPAMVDLMLKIVTAYLLFGSSLLLLSDLLASRCKRPIGTQPQLQGRS